MVLGIIMGVAFVADWVLYETTGTGLFGHAANALGVGDSYDAVHSGSSGMDYDYFEAWFVRFEDYFVAMEDWMMAMTDWADWMATYVTYILVLSVLIVLLVLFVLIVSWQTSKRVKNVSRRPYDG